MISEIDHAALRTALGNVCLAAAGVKVKALDTANAATTNAVAATIEGKFVAVSIIATLSTATVFKTGDAKRYADLQPAKVAAPVNPGCTRIYVVAANTSAACVLFEGDRVAADTNSNETPAIPPDTVALGIIKIVVGTGAGAVPFQLGTTALATDAGAKLTVTFVDVYSLWDHY